MFGQKPVMLVERTISSSMAVDWTGEMSREELLAPRIRQLERRPEDVEQAKAKAAGGTGEEQGPVRLDSLALAKEG